MKESKKSQTLKFRSWILLIVPARFQFKGGMAADAVKMDSPDSRGYVIGNEGSPVIEAYPAGTTPPSVLIVVPTAALSAEFRQSLDTRFTQSMKGCPIAFQSLSPGNSGTLNQKPASVPGFLITGAVF